MCRCDACNWATAYLNVDRIALVVQAQDIVWRVGERTHRLGDAVGPRVPEGVVLRKHRDVLRLDPPDPDEVAHGSARFLRITWTIIENIAVRWIASREVRAGKGAEKEGFALEREGRRNRSSRAAEIANEAEHVPVIVQILNDAERFGRFVAVIGDDQFELSTTDPSRTVCFSEGCIDAEFQLPARFTIGAPEWRSHAEADFLVADTVNSWFLWGELPG